MLFAILTLALTLQPHASPADRPSDVTARPADASQSDRMPRVYRSLNEQWRFNLADHPGAEDPVFDDSGWRRVNVPHTWNADDSFDKERSYFRGVGWYRRPLRLGASYEGRRLFLHFGAANQVAEVFVNGSSVGQHIGGYTAFAFDITDAVSINGENVIAVRVDNRHDDDIPPLNADFTFFGGIYRSIRLIAADPFHIDVLDHASPGVFIDTPEISESSAVVRIRGHVVNGSQEPQVVEVLHRVLDPGRNAVAVLQAELDIGPGERRPFEQHSEPINHPALWTPDDPVLYTVRTEIRSGDRLLDAVENPLGFRWVEVDAQRGFLLNGRPLKLLGTNRHQDFPGLGNALPDAYHRRDVELVKETGFNFLRTAHYPQDPVVLETADRLGLIVWEETPVVNIISMSDAFAKNSERMLVEMIRQHYNHPSVVFWGYMNEVMLRRPDPVPEGYYERLIEVSERLENVLKAEDPFRPSVTAISLHEIDNGTGFGDIPDVHGMNLYFGWYYHELATWGEYLDSLHAARPDRVYLVSEYGAGSDERVHTLEPRAFDFSSEYIQDFHMAAFEQMLERDYIVGTAVWNQFDFSSNHRQDTRNALNQKGLLFHNRTPKDVWYYYRAKLLDRPVLHIGREWLIRAGSRPEDARQPIRVFTNCESVAFTLNGAPIGTHSPRNAFIEVMLALAPGVNLLEVEGTCGSGAARDAVVLRYEDRTRLFSEKAPAGARVAVNAGAHYSFTDAAGVLWEWDRAYEPEASNWGYREGTARRTHRRMLNTDDDPLFQAFREGEHVYVFDVPPGTYAVELGLVEPSIGAAGERVFDVEINDEVIWADVDLAGQFGTQRIVRLSTLVHVEGGQGLRIALKRRAGEPVLSAILVVRK